MRLKRLCQKINLSNYPQFYKNSYNKKKIDSVEFNNYWKTNKNIFLEEYFSVLLYYALDIPNKVSNSFLINRTRYEELYGNSDVSGTLFLLAAGKFEKAISNKNQKEFDKAAEFTSKANSKEDANKIIEQFRKRYLLAQNKWSEVYKLNETLKNNNQFNEDAVNSFSWDVYEKCNDKNVIIKCAQWMKELTDKEPNYANLDTYACILYKSGNIIEAKRIANLAIETGKKNNENTSSTEKFLKKIQ